MSQANDFAGSSSVTNVSRNWCCCSLNPCIPRRRFTHCVSTKLPVFTLPRFGYYGNWAPQALGRLASQVCHSTLRHHAAHHIQSIKHVHPSCSHRPAQQRWCMQEVAMTQARRVRRLYSRASLMKLPRCNNTRCSCAPLPCRLRYALLWILKLPYASSTVPCHLSALYLSGTKLPHPRNFSTNSQLSHNTL
jgi:hypothetical protein